MVLEKEEDEVKERRMGRRKSSVLVGISGVASV